MLTPSFGNPSGISGTSGVVPPLSQRTTTVTPTSASPIGPPAQEAPPRKVANLLEDLTRLLQAPLAPAEFHAEFLARVLSALRGVAGVIWARSSQGHFQLQYQINLAEIG